MHLFLACQRNLKIVIFGHPKKIGLDKKVSFQKNKCTSKIFFAQNRTQNIKPGKAILRKTIKKQNFKKTTKKPN